MEQVYEQFLRKFEDKSYPWINQEGRNKAVVIAEGNTRWQVPLVLRNFKHFLGDEWNLYVICTQYNVEWMQQKVLKDSRVLLTIADTPRINTEVFNSLYKDPKFWNSFKEEHILTIQADCICCKPLNHIWLNFDMVGAPCGIDTFNGGLSLRKRSTMLECLRRYGPFADNTAEPEDVFFTKCLRLMDAQIPNGYDAARFAVESFYYELPFGVHGTDKGYHGLHVAERIVEQVVL